MANNEIMERAIVYLDMMDYFIECERLVNSSLKNIPLIIGGNKDRGTVVACSREARRFGVRPSMSLGYAYKLCPQARLLKGDYENYTKKSLELSEIIGDKTPSFEKSSMHSFFLDVSGMDKFFGCFSWTNELSAHIYNHSGLNPRWALSVNKTVSRIGAESCLPNNPINISNSLVRPFLNPLSIQKLPQLGDKTFQLFSRIGIREIGKVAEMPPLVVQKIVGKRGKTIWQRANGIDKDPVEPYKEKKEISLEYDFETDSIDLVLIKGRLTYMTEQLAFKLRKQELLTSKVVVKVKYNNLDTETSQRRITYTSLDHLLKVHVMELFQKLYRRRMRLLKVGVKFTQLVPGSHQVDLFEDTHEILSLYKSMDHIRKRYGTGAVGMGTLIK
ncbi:MAG: DNA polymerase IV [Flavobacteriales bacterium]